MVHGIKDLNDLTLLVRREETVHSNGGLCLPSYYDIIYHLDIKRKELPNSEKSIKSTWPWAYSLPSTGQRSRSESSFVTFKSISKVILHGLIEASF